jgi:hypothetical protein
MTRKQKEIFRQIDLILWNDWDPIGINHIKSARDEYYDYIAVFFKLIYNNASISDFTEQLTYISTNTMGLSANIDHDKFVANRLFELKKVMINNNESKR